MNVGIGGYQFLTVTTFSFRNHHVICLTMIESNIVILLPHFCQYYDDTLEKINDDSSINWDIFCSNSYIVHSCRVQQQRSIRTR